MDVRAACIGQGTYGSLNCERRPKLIEVWLWYDWCNFNVGLELLLLKQAPDHKGLLNPRKILTTDLRP